MREDKNDKSLFSNNWGNATTVFRWNKIFSAKLFSNFSLYYSRFQHEQLNKAKDENSNVLFKTTSDLQDISFKTDFDYYVNPRYTIRFGSKISHLIFKPDIIQIKNMDSDIKFNDEFRNSAREANLFMENTFNFDHFKMNLGGRFSSYFINGTNYINFEPRVSASVNILPRVSISTSYTEMAQHIHLLTNSSLGMPTDLWVASTAAIGPQLSRQVASGIEYKSGSGYVFGAEGYYKKLDHVIRFDEGTAFLNPKESNWEKNVLVGQARAYGVEFLAEKNSGRLTGIFSYTLSWSECKFSELNHGNWFPFKYDRRHDISILAEYQLNERHNKKRSVSAGFTLQSGNNLSIPDIQTAGVLLPGFDYSTYNKPWEMVRYTYDHPNNFKMPVFHHLDLGYSIAKQNTDSKNITWTFSIYNVYNRMNPWYYYKSPDGQVKQVSLFPVIPSVGFKYNF